MSVGNAQGTSLVRSKDLSLRVTLATLGYTSSSSLSLSVLWVTKSILHVFCFTRFSFSSIRYCTTTLTSTVFFFFFKINHQPSLFFHLRIRIALRGPSNWLFIFSRTYFCLTLPDDHWRFARPPSIAIFLDMFIGDRWEKESLPMMKRNSIRSESVCGRHRSIRLSRIGPVDEKSRKLCFSNIGGLLRKQPDLDIYWYLDDVHYPRKIEKDFSFVLTIRFLIKSDMFPWTNSDLSVLHDQRQSSPRRLSSECNWEPWSLASLSVECEKNLFPRLHPHRATKRNVLSTTTHTRTKKRIESSCWFSVVSICFHFFCCFYSLSLAG